MSQLLEGPPPRRVTGALDASTGTSAPALYHNGIPYDEDEGGFEVAIDTTNAVSFYHQGLPMTANGRIAVDTSSAINNFSSGGMPLTAGGKLATVGTGVDFFNCGVAYSSANRVVT